MLMLQRVRSNGSAVSAVRACFSTQPVPSAKADASVSTDKATKSPVQYANLAYVDPSPLVQRLKEALLFKPGAITYETYKTDKGPTGQAYRHPSPMNQPTPNIPLVEDEDLIYNVTHYTRDYKRHGTLHKNTTLWNVEEDVQKRAYLAEGKNLDGSMKEIEGKEGEPVDPAVQKKKDQQAWDGNLGLKIPAVLRYDPTGTRVAVTTTDAETRKLIEKQKPWHLPQAEWCKNTDAIVAECKRLNIPIPVGKTYSPKPDPTYDYKW